MNDVDDLALKQRMRKNKVVDPYTFLLMVGNNEILPISQTIQNNLVKHHSIWNIDKNVCFLGLSSLTIAYGAKSLILPCVYFMLGYAYLRRRSLISTLQQDPGVFG